jgi:hypothetical protein
MLRAFARASLLVALGATTAWAEVVRIDVRRRDDAGTHERIIARVHFATDPRLPANRAIVDLAHAPRNADGLVEYSSDLLFFQPKAPERARGAVFLEIVNRGRDQALGLMTGAVQRSLAPESWSMGDGFLLERGFAVAFLGWQFDVTPAQGLTFQAPVAPVDGRVRASAIIVEAGSRDTGFALPYCAASPTQAGATVTYRQRMDAEGETLAGSTWHFDRNGCVVILRAPVRAGLYEAVYTSHGSPVAGLGLAAVRDFASYLKHGGSIATLRESPSTMRRIIGFGYSQSGRFLREFVRDGFNADERGRAAFDGLLIASAGAGGGSFNHRFSMPGQAGNSVLSILRPVDVPPFTDEGLLARARAASVVPRIFYTFSSTEYWARAGSLTHTTDDGARDVPLAESSRLYLLSGTPHSGGPLPPIRETANGDFRNPLNFAQQRWPLRALLIAMDDWIGPGKTPPASRYPLVARRELVDRASVTFPATGTATWPQYMPSVWRLDFGPEFASAGIIREPPRLGAPYRVLVPQVDADGNDRGGVPLLEVAVPLGTFTGWNVLEPPLRELGYLSGLTGSFVPFARTRGERRDARDDRPSIEERYRGVRDYLDRVDKSAAALVRDGFLLKDDVGDAVARARQMWDVLVGPAAEGGQKTLP